MWRTRTFLLCLVAGGGVLFGGELVSGVPTPFSASSSAFLVGGSGFQITVPAPPTRLEVRVATTNAEADVDVFIRYGEDVAVAGGQVQSDCQVPSDGKSTFVAIYGQLPYCPTMLFRPGTYFIALRVSTAVSGTIMAVADTGPQNALPARQLASGIAAGFAFGKVDLPQLYNGPYSYAIPVPANATSLTINLATDNPNANVDLHVRRGQDVASISVADISATTPGGNETITLNASSSPPLQGGSTYYISLRLISNAVLVTGTVTATVTAPPPPTVTPLTSGQASPFSFPAQTTPSLAGNWRLTVPAGVSRLEFRLATTTAGANLDLYYRFGQPVEDPSLAGQPRGETSSGNEQISLAAGPFQPIQAGDYYLAVRIVTTGVAVAGTITATYTTTATGPAIDVAPASLDFGSVPVGQTRDRELTVRNVGSLALTVSAITSSNPNYTVVSPSIPFTLAPGVQQAVRVRFTAPSLGSQPGSLSIASNDPVLSVVNVSLLGTGATAAGPSLNLPPSLDFGAVTLGQSRDLALAVRNTGGATLTVTAVTSSNAQFTVVSPPAPFNVAPAGQQDVIVRFRPSAAGLQAGTLTLASNDAGNPAPVVALRGSGEAGPTGPVITLSTTAISFDTPQGVTPAAQRFTVRNSGAGTLNFRVTSSQTWLLASPTTGSSTGNEVAITVSVNVAGLGPGSYTGELRVTEGTGPAAAPDPPRQAAAVVTVRLAIGAGQCPPGPPGAPAVTSAGIVNAASFISPALPNGGIARGSIFTIFGANLGPNALLAAARFPLETTLGCVSVRVTRGGTSVDAIPLAVAANQINAILPSSAPVGDAALTVTFNGRTSAAAAVRIVEASFGAFTVNQNGMGPAILQNFVSQTEQPLNSPQRPARPGQVVTLWGTGLGAISAPDNVAPPAGDLPTAVEILVGGKTARKLYSGRGPCCAGLDQIVFEVPLDAPLGCFVPLLVRAGGVSSNTVTMAISSDGAACSDPANPLGRYLSRGGRIGSAALVRLNARLQLDPAANFTDIDADAGAAVFTESRGGEYAYNPILGLPPIGTCAVFSAGNIDLSGLLAGQIPGNLQGDARILNAGAALVVSGPRGVKTIPRSTDLGGLYFNVLGGAIPLLGPPAQPLYLDPGEYTIAGPAGPDVGSFTARLRVPSAVNWTNRDQLVQVTRANGVTVNWTGGDPASQGVSILGGNLDNVSGAGAAFVCFAALRDGGFTVPPAILNVLPASNLQRPDQSTGFLAIAAGPAGDVPAFSAAGLDAGFAYFGQVNLLSVVWR